MNIDGHRNVLIANMYLEWPNSEKSINAVKVFNHYFPQEYSNTKESNVDADSDPPKGLAHIYEKHPRCEIIDCIICEGGLLVCITCGQGENELEEVCPGSTSKIVTAANITKENNYKWKGAENTLVYKGYNWSVNAYRHEFALITRPDRVWCQVLTKDLNLMEKICN